MTEAKLDNIKTKIKENAFYRKAERPAVQHELRADAAELAAP